MHSLIKGNCIQLHSRIKVRLHSLKGVRLQYFSPGELVSDAEECAAYCDGEARCNALTYLTSSTDNGLVRSSVLLVAPVGLLYQMSNKLS